MEVQILGAHQRDSRETRSTSLVIDGNLALDAGSLATTLTFDEQQQIRSVLLSHFHYDHVKDLGAFGFNVSDWGTVDVYCLESVRENLLRVMFNGELWLDLTKFPSPEQPSLRFHAIEPYHSFEVGNYQVQAPPGHHSVPIVGFIVGDQLGRRLLYTSDTGRGWHDMLEQTWADLIITEVTFHNGMEQLADQVSHQTPSALKEELQKIGDRWGRLPRVVVIHLTPSLESVIRSEIRGVAADLGAEIIIGSEGLRVRI